MYVYMYKQEYESWCLTKTISIMHKPVGDVNLSHAQINVICFFKNIIQDILNLSLY